MRTSILAFTALAAVASAQWTPEIPTQSTKVNEADYRYTVASKPFRLFLKSSNTTLDGTALDACHQMILTKRLCYSGLRSNNATYPQNYFHHNVSSVAPDQPNAVDRPGVLGYTFESLLGEVRPLSMNIQTGAKFVNDPTPNIGVPIFDTWYTVIPYTLVNFDQCGRMYRADTENPPMNVKNWYMCDVRYNYQYETLVWKIGLTSELNNPTCQKVEVERVWVDGEGHAGKFCGK